MITKKVLIGSIAGGLVYFLLGWVVYGILMKDYCAANFSQDGMRKEEEMILWAMGVGNIAFAMIIALAINWTNSKSILDGAKIGALIGFLFAISIDFSFYAMTTMYKSMSVIFVDIVVATVMAGIVGLVVCWAMCFGKKAE